MTLGCMIGYAVGRFAARGAVARLMGQRNMDRLSALTARHGLWALLLTRPVPVLAEAAVLFAGLARLRWPAFLALSGAANLALSILYAAIGSFAVTTAGFVVAFVAALAAPALFILGLSRLERSREKPR
jgi:3-dehydroquinate synthase